MTDRTDRETPRPDIDLIECIADSLLAPAGIASVLIKEDLLACIAYIRAQDARIAALEAEEQSAERRGIERAARKLVDQEYAYRVRATSIKDTDPDESIRLDRIAGVYGLAVRLVRALIHDGQGVQS